ncbi:MAG TPA: phosphopantetheine-binding protein [Myxococcota bacterium]|nr:phosphopantetheine-binding protein [Myxococcota bacterium]HRY93800.1 phosphopantetheine-binding protein [Myxococcota bacterium]HSA24569.1 phosphopantetheine-binding protein [Myxococcota bacterium]
MTDLEIELRDKLIARLDLKDVDPSQITSASRLFGEDLGLDSIDALELEVMIQEHWGIQIKASERNRSTFGTLGDLARFIQANLGRDSAREDGSRVPKAG